MDFKQQLADYQQLINNELTKYLRHEPCYEQRWNEAMEYSLMAGGKTAAPHISSGNLSTVPSRYRAVPAVCRSYRNGAQLFLDSRRPARHRQ